MIPKTAITIPRNFLVRGAILTLASFGVGQVIRLITNVLLARMLAPELLGIMLIVYSFRTGIELISDLGIGQNIVYNKNANEPDFYNTAWTLQVIRGFFLWGIFSAIAIPIAGFYRLPILATVIPLAALANVISGFASTGRFLVQKRMNFGTLIVFDLFVSLVGSVAQIVWAYFDPTIWALVYGPLIGTLALAIGSYFLLPDVRQRFCICRRYVGEILSFGKWIFASSIIFFLSTNLDRLYLAKTIPLAFVGIYGIARSFSELMSASVFQLGNSVVFPYISSQSHALGPELRPQAVAPLRMKFVLLAGTGLAVFASTADLAIQILYDSRYHAAGWMLPILIFGAWFAMLANLNESILLGLGRPSYSLMANLGKLLFLALGLTLGVAHFGIAGGVIAVAISDIFRYLPTVIGQIRQRFSFLSQDILATTGVFALIVLLQWLRRVAGFGSSFDEFPIDFTAIF